MFEVITLLDNMQINSRFGVKKPKPVRRFTKVKRAKTRKFDGGGSASTPSITPQKPEEVKENKEVKAVAKEHIESAGFSADKKMDTSPEAMKSYNKNLSAFAEGKPASTEEAKPSSLAPKKRTSTEEAERPTSKEEDNQNKSASTEEAKPLSSASKTTEVFLKADKSNPRDISDAASTVLKEKAENPNKKMSDIIKDHPKTSKLSLGIGLAVLGVALGAAVAVIAPGMALVVGMHALDKFLGSELSTKLLDRLVSKHDSDESESEDEESTPKKRKPNKNDTEDDNDEDEDDNDYHKRADSIIGSQSDAMSDIVDNIVKDPKIRKDVVSDIQNEFKAQKQADLEPVEGKPNDIKKEWADRYDKHKAILSDPDSSDEDKKHSKKITEAARKIIGGAATQEEALKPDNDEVYDQVKDTVANHEDIQINDKDIQKKHKLTDEQTKSLMDRMEKEGLVTKADKDGNRGIYEEEEEETNSSDYSLQDIVNSLNFDEFKNEWSSVLALLNRRPKKPGHDNGNGLDDLDNLGPAHIGPFKLGVLDNITDGFDAIVNKDGKIIDYYNSKNPIMSLLDIDNDFTNHVSGPTFAALKLHPASARLLKAWCENKGIKGVYSKGDFHITVCHSKDPITYKPMVFTDGPREVYPSHFDLMGKDLEKKFVVLKLKYGFPNKRFKYARDIGASHDFPDYLPHISIAKPGHGMRLDELKQLNVMDMNFPLIVDYEYVEPIANFLVEAISKEKAFDIFKDKFSDSLINDNSFAAHKIECAAYEQSEREGGKSASQLDPSVLKSEQCFDKIWAYITSVLGSEKYTYNVMQWYVGTKKNPQSMKRLEDAGRAKEALMLKERFKDAINKETDLQKYRDLNQITFKQLEDLADVLKSRTTANQYKADYEQNLIKSGQAKILYNDDDWKVVIPKSVEAAKYYGRNTRWCTATSNDEDNRYLQYANDGDLYIFIHKKDNKKWQIHFESNQFMNAQDEEIEGDSKEDQHLLGSIFNKVITKSNINKIKKNSSIFNILVLPFVSPEEQLNIIKQNGSAIRHIKDPTEEVQLAAVKQNGSAIRHIKDPTEEMKLEAVKQNSLAIRFIENPTDEMKLEAVKQDGRAIQFIKNPTEGTKLEAVKQNGYAIRYIKDPTEEMKLEAVKEDGSAIQYIKDPTEEMKLEAVKQNGHAIYFIKDPTNEMKLEAVKQDGRAIQYIKDPTEEMKTIAVKQNGYAIEFIKNSTEEMKLSKLKSESALVKAASRIGSAIVLKELPPDFRGVKPLNRGTTSIIFPRDEDTVFMFTKDGIKMDWLKSNNLLLDYSTYESNLHPKSTLRDIIIYKAIVKKLYPLNALNKRIVKDLVNYIDSVKPGKFYYGRQLDPEYSGVDDHRQAYLNNIIENIDKEIPKNQYKQIAHDIANFLMNYKANQYYFDIRQGNFMQTKDGQLVLSDPIVSAELLNGLTGRRI